MKIFRFVLFVVTLFTLGSLLTSCSGGAMVAASWPGMLVDANKQTVYVASGPHVYAVNLGNGSEKWRFPTKADSKISFYASPALTDAGQLVIGGYNNVFYSINPDNGAQNWTFSGATNRYLAGPAVSGQNIYAPSADYNLYTLNSVGSLIWKFTAGNSLWAAPALDGKTLYLPSMDHSFYALDSGNGTQIWKTGDLGGSMVGVPTLSQDGSTIYIGNFNSQLIALNSKTGQVLWQTPTTGWVWSGPLLEGDALYFGDMAGTFWSLNAKDGTVRWKIQPDTAPQRSITGKPLVVGKTVYFGDQNGNFYAADVSNGSLLWTKTFPGQLYSNVVGAGDLILLAPIKTDSVLIALDQNGNQKWAFVPAK